MMSPALTGKPRTQSPQRAYERSRIDLTLVPPDAPGDARLEMRFELSLARKAGTPQLIALTMDAEQNATLAALADQAERRLAGAPGSSGALSAMAR